MRLAKSHTKKFEFLSFWGGFHGKTAGTLSLIGDGTKKQPRAARCPARYHAPYADCYRCPLGLEYPSCGIACAEFARKVIKHATTGALAAILIEPIQGTAGNVVPPPEFMPAVQRDRQGERRAAHQRRDDQRLRPHRDAGSAASTAGVEPDVVTMGKGLGGGFPVSGLASTDEITQAKPWGSAVGLELELRRQPDGRRRDPRRRHA